MNLDQFHCFANALSDATLMVTADGTIQAVNRRLEAALGLPAKDIVGRPFAEFVAQPHHELDQYLRYCLRSSDAVRGAVTLTEAQGQKRRYLCEGGLLRPRSGDTEAVVMLRLLSRDVSISQFTALNEKLAALHCEIERRQQVEQTLRHSEARKSAMLATALDAIVTIDHTGKIVDFNPAAEQIFGYHRQQAVGREMADLIMPSSFREQHYQALQHYLVTGDGHLLGQRIELAARRADGSEFPIELAVSAIPGEKHPMFTAYIRDITEHKEHLSFLEEQLRLAAFGRDVGLVISQAKSIQEMLHQCTCLIVRHLEGAFARIWSLHHQDQVLELRASAGIYTHLDGVHSRIPIGHYKIGLIARTQQPHLTNAVLGDSRIHDQEWARREGMVAFAGYPLVVDGCTIGVMAMFAKHALSDMTLTAMESVANSLALGMERKRIERELYRQTELLKAVDKKKDEFLAMLAHELRNPLAPIRTGLELLRLDPNDPDTIVMLQQQVDHMVRLVDDLLDMSRIMRGKIELQRQPMRLTDILSRAIATVQPFVDQRGHELLVTQPEAPVWVHADLVRLSQVLSNLLHNAVKYTPDRGRIHLDIQRGDDQAIICVKDNGIGIEADFLPEIFELFTQGDRSLDRSVSGLGIGLTLVRRLVELHGGRISAHSEGLGQGSEFVLCLPIVMAPEDEPTVGDSLHKLPQAAAPRCRILVVDDNVSSTRVMHRLLGTLWKHEVEIAHDGREALEVARTFRPDIIFLDIGLPGMDGFEAARKLRQQPETTHSLLVALTGYGSTEDRRKSQEAGFDLHLVKPVTAQVLRDVIAQFRSTSDGRQA